jgi:signal peptidase II
MLRGVGAGGTFLTAAIAVVVVDQWLKALVLARPVAGGAGFMRIQVTRSPGTLAGRLGLRTPVLVAVWLACVAVLLAPGLRSIHDGLAWFALGAAVGGALGNLVDVIRRDGVVDYLRVGSWPAFNLADVAIVAGVAGALVAG